MADSQVIFKRTKPKATQRSRIISDINAPSSKDSNDESEAQPSPSAIASKVKSKMKKPKSTLSFGGDDEDSGGEVFKIKKSNLSRKLALGTHPASPANVSTSDRATTPARGPVYDKAYLSELKASTPTNRPPVTTKDDPYDADMSMDIDSVGDMTVEMTDVFDAGETVIPSQASVLAAKEKRESLRSRGAKSGTEDFISLSVTKRSEEYQGPHPESRLVREEDELGEGDDEFSEYTSAKTRIALGKKARKVEASKRRDEMQELIADAEEVDEETQEWEQEQIRRGGMKEEEAAPVMKQVYKPAPIPPLTVIPSLDPSIARLSQQMTALTTSHAQNTSSMSSLAEEQAALDKREDELREIITKAELKRSWFASFREWIESVATFLDEKFPQLEDLEEEHISILKERRDMIRQRRLADSEDDLSSFLGTLPVAPHTAPEELDELGRIVPRGNPLAARRDRQTARINRRTLRRQRAAPPNDEEGYSTDATLPPSDAADYRTALHKLSGRRDKVLSDVRAAEFRTPSRGIGEKFGEWRERFSDSYTGAWGGLGLVGAWEFWVRLEMLGWNPFEDARSLDSFGWYSDLHKYSRPRRDEDEDEEPDLGPDGDLVSAMISTAVIPRLAKVVENGALDPVSRKDVRRMIDLAEEIEISLEKSNLKFQVLLKAVVTNFREAIGALDASQQPFLGLNNPPFSPEAIPARNRLLARHRKLLSNIVRWRGYAGGLFGIDELVIALVTNCMLPIADSGWEVGGEESMRQVLKNLPQDLVSPQLKSRLNIV
ncbi:hypothetical protein BV25DRAFT_1919473 [Artomyces pyxidatus]|uniref:Uncharacterized protein n=1 Tax=Artomyces pyxidatus TaxID=48021 RepID=A0ACB8SR02_9AGAM|nr:hypothetical protein BV25DRAFT_1919473 [Artomyces pyxidatus]